MLIIQELNKTYQNGVRALDNVTLNIPTGLFGLLGPNGAGKSSLLRTIATLQEPDSGSIYFKDIDVIGDKEILRRQLGYLPQDFGVYPKVTAEQLLNHLAVLKGMSVRNERREIVENMLHQVNLWDVRKLKLGTYSGGMLKRFGIAQALLGAPSLVLVDEPTAGLDPIERNRFLNLLAKIGENIVVILSTHTVQDVTDLCPKMAMIVKGSVLLQGSPQTAINELQNKVWRKQIKQNFLKDYQTQFNVLSVRLLGGLLQVHVHSERQPDDGFVQVEPDLEDVYFLKMKHAEHSPTSTTSKLNQALYVA